MKLSELAERVMGLIPSAQFEEDNEGQLVIYTNMTEVPIYGAEGQIVDFELVDFEPDSGQSESVRPGDFE